MSIQIRCKLEKKINYAEILLGKPVISEVIFENLGDRDRKGYCVIETLPDCTIPFTCILELPVKQNVRINPEILLNKMFFKQEKQEISANIRIAVYADQKQLLTEKIIEVQVHPYCYWNGKHKTSLAVFVQQEDAAIQNLIEEAAALLQERNLKPISGYVDCTKEEVIQQAEAVFRVLCQKNIHYIEEKNNISEQGQFVRLGKMIFEQDIAQANILELSLLYASCLESIGLHSMLAFTNQHILAGFWSDAGDKMPEGLSDEQQFSEECLMNRGGNFIPVECTVLADDSGISFESAVLIGCKNMKDVVQVLDVNYFKELKKSELYKLFIEDDNDSIIADNIDDNNADDNNVDDNMEADILQEEIEPEKSEMKEEKIRKDSRKENNFDREDFNEKNMDEEEFNWNTSFDEQGDSDDTFEDDIFEDDTFEFDEYEIYPFKTDSSQSYIIQQAEQNKNLAVVAPDITGKIQTIANLVLMQMEQGKHILVISNESETLYRLEKLLDSIDIAEFFNILAESDGIEAVLKHLRQTITYSRNGKKKEYMLKEDEYQLQNYQKYRDIIEKFYEKMYQGTSCGQSLHELIVQYEKYRKMPYSISWHKAEEAVNHRAARDIVRDFSIVYEQCKLVDMNPSQLLQIAKLSQDRRRILTEGIEDCINKYAELEASAINFCKQIAIDEMKIPLSKTELDLLMEYADILVTAHQVDSKIWKLENPIDLEKMKLLCKRYEEKERMRQKLTSFFLDDELEAIDANVFKDILDTLEEAAPQTRKYKVAVRELRKSWKKYIQKPWSEELTQDEIFSLEEYLDMLAIYQQNKFSEEAKKLLEIFPNLEILQQKGGFYKEIIDRIGEFTIDEAISIEAIVKEIALGNKQEILLLAKELLHIYEEYSENISKTIVLLNPDVEMVKKTFRKDYPNASWIDLFKQWKQGISHIELLKAYMQEVEEAEHVGIIDIIYQLEQKVKPEEMEQAFKKCWCEYNLYQLIDSCEELGEFNSVLYELNLDKYKRCLLELRKSLNIKIIKTISENIQIHQEQLQRLFFSLRESTVLEDINSDNIKVLLQTYPCLLINSAWVKTYSEQLSSYSDLVVIDGAEELLAEDMQAIVTESQQYIVFGKQDPMAMDIFYENKEKTIKSIWNHVLQLPISLEYLKYNYDDIASGSQDMFDTHEEIIYFPNRQSTEMDELQEEEDGLIRIIADSLRRNHYQVHTNVGIGKFKVDVAIIDDAHTDTYLLGILLDHPRQTDISIRDREIICKEILQEKGWNLHRIYSVTWYRSPQAQVEEIEKIIQNLKHGRN